MYSIRTLLLLMTLLVSRPSVVAQVPILGEKIELYSKFLQEEQEICLNLPYHSCEYDLPNYAQNAQIWNDSLRQLLDSNTAYSFHFYPQKTHYNLVPNAIFDGILALYPDWEFAIPPDSSTVEK